MDRQSVESKMIRSIGYDIDNQTLEIEYNSGAVWQYFEFSESLWYEFENADSKGSFYHREIKSQYSESRIG